MFWVEEYRRDAFVLTIIDTFTRVTLHWSLGYSMKWTDVRRAWEAVIENHLQPADMLAKGFDIEVRSDNGPQLLANRLESSSETITSARFILTPTRLRKTAT